MTIIRKMSHQSTRLDKIRLLQKYLLGYHIYWWSYWEKLLFSKNLSLNSHNSFKNNPRLSGIPSVDVYLSLIFVACCMLHAACCMRCSSSLCSFQWTNVKKIIQYPNGHNRYSTIAPPNTTQSWQMIPFWDPIDTMRTRMSELSRRMFILHARDILHRVVVPWPSFLTQ
jgi:hypothetical protein